MPRLPVVFLLFLLCAGLPGLAQPEMANWYFGNKAGIRFLDDTVVALTDGQMVADEGCSTISDRQGRLLFYSNGLQVWGRDHQVLPNGSGLAAHFSSTQAALFVPHPGDHNLFYLFTTGAVAQGDNAVMAYSIIDLRLNNGVGDVTVKNQVLMQPTTEKLCGIRHANGRDLWVVGHEMGTDAFYAYLVSVNGLISNPVVSHSGTVHDKLPPPEPWPNIYAQGHMKVNRSGNLLGVAIQRKVVELHNFNSINGTISLKSTFPDKFGACYGLEFSPNGEHIYVSYAKNEQASKLILQIDLLLLEATSFENALTIIRGPASEVFDGALQRGSDERIYVARVDKPFLGVIRRPNEAGLSCDYNDSYFNFISGVSIGGLPNFINEYPPVFPTSSHCLNRPIIFSLPENEVVDSVKWLFYNPPALSPFITSAISPTFTFQNTGRYKVQLLLYANGQIDTLTRFIDVHPLPSINLGADTLLYDGESLQLNATQQGAAYLWQDGSTSNTFTVADHGTYWVQLTDRNGCTASDTVRISYTSIKIPNIFTPNADGLNDVFVAYGIELYTWQMQIFDRWGKQVFFSDKYANNWAALGLPEGMYYYALSNHRLRKHFKGWVQVAR